MADCNKTLEELQLFLDGELTDDEREHVLEHLEECLDCFHAFDFEAELKQVIARKCSNDTMPADLLARIRGSLLAEGGGESAEVAGA